MIGRILQKWDSDKINATPLPKRVLSNKTELSVSKHPFKSYVWAYIKKERIVQSSLVGCRFKKKCMMEHFWKMLCPYLITWNLWIFKCKFRLWSTRKNVSQICEPTQIWTNVMSIFSKVSKSTESFASTHIQETE